MTTSTQAFASAFDIPRAQRRRVTLRRGGVLRLDDARGACVRVARGRVWLTEEGARDDVVLEGNGSHLIASRGRVVVAADRTSRVALEWPAAADSPRMEVADREGGAGRRLPGRPGPFAWLAALFDVSRTAAPDAPARDDVSPDAVRDRLAALVPLLRC